MGVTAGNKVYKTIRRPDQQLIEQFRGIPSSNIGDMMNRLYNMQGDIKCFCRNAELLGTAFTIKAPEGDNLFFHLAIELAQPGDILVVDGGGSDLRSLCGEMMYTEAKQKGIAGFVINGCIRDVDCLEHLQFPVYAKGVTPQGPWKNGPGEINVPVCCGGQVIMPGDILVGDVDGVVIVHPEDAEEVAALAHKKFDSEQKTLEERDHGVVDDQMEFWMSSVNKLNTAFMD